MDFGKLKWIAAVTAFLLISATGYGITSLLGEPSLLLSVGVSAFSVIGVWLSLHGLARRVGMMPFKAKGRVLRGAKVRLDSAQPLPAPTWMAESPDDEHDLPPLSYYRLELTIAPMAPKGAFQFWDPYDLSCVPKGFRATWTSLADEQEPGFELEDLELWDGQGFSKDFDKVPGRQRLRFKVGVPVGAREIQMLYYFETFGKLVLPPHDSLPPHEGE